MKKSKKLVLAGFVLLAAITGLLALTGCKTEVDTSSPQQEQADDEDCTYDEATNTYTVYTADGLFAVAELVNGGAYSANITLAADIVLNENLADKVTVAEDGTVSADTSVRTWMPMGGEYQGTFDGGNHTITGLYCAYNGYSETGLISTLAEGATVKNVKIHDFCLEVNCGGAVVGCNRGEVIGCSISGTGILGWITNYQYVGGVVAFNDGTVKDCTSSAALTFRGIGYFGGIVGQNMTSQATVIGCSNSGTITAAGYVEMNVGGITGGGMGTVKDCYNTGSISTTVEDGSVQVGGIAGWMEGTVSGCYNTGSISATVEDGSVRVGGIAGKAEGTVSGCYNIGSVDSGTYSGGIAANAYGGTFADCYYLDTCVKTGSPEYSSADGITEKTSDQFASGEVAYLLNGDQSTITFKQTLLTDDYPSFTGGTVYRVGVTCTEGAEAYANTQSDLDHNYTDGICTACGEVYDHSGSTNTAVTDRGNGTHGYDCTVCGLLLPKPMQWMSPLASAASAALT